MAEKTKPTFSYTFRINAIVITLCVFTLVPLLALGVYDRPSADDFTYSLLTHEAFQNSGGNPIEVLKAAVETSAQYYNSWQGLYTSAFLLALQPGIAGSQWYPIGCYLIITFMIGACLYFAYCIERHALRATTRLWPAAGFLLATLLCQCMPYANEGIYWYNGAANYTPIFFATLISAGLCITALSVSKRSQVIAAIAGATIVSFIISGGNYMPAFFNLMIMVGFAGIGFIKKRPALAVPLAASIVGFAISAMAPGTAIRQEALSSMFGKPSVATTLLHSTYQAIMDLRTFIDLPVIVFLIAIVPLIAIWIRHSNITASWKLLGLATLAAFIFMVGSLCVPYYAAGSFGEGRTRDAAFFIDLTLIVVLWGYFICCIANSSKRRLNRIALKAMQAGVVKIFLYLACALAVVVLFGSQLAGHGNSLIAARSLATGEAAQYAQEYDEREALMLESTDGTARISTLSVRPQLLFFSDVIRNEDNWGNALAQYYGLESVIVEEPAEDDQLAALPE